MIQRVIVKKEDTYYQCQPRELSDKSISWKCGVCLYGRINPYGSKRNQDYKCKRCGAELTETIVETNYFNMRSYCP